MNEPTGVLKYRFEFENGSVFLCNSFKDHVDYITLSGAYVLDGGIYSEGRAPVNVTSTMRYTWYELPTNRQVVPLYWDAMNPDINKIAGVA